MSVHELQLVVIDQPNSLKIPPPPDIKRALATHIQRNGTLHGIGATHIRWVLRLSPEYDPHTNEPFWNFRVDGRLCAIWSHAGSSAYGTWSTFGPQECFVRVFGDKHVTP